MKSFENTRSETKSPLPHAGESLREMLLARRFDILYWMVVTISVFLLAFQEWINYWLKRPPSPIISTIVFVGVAGFSGRRI